MRGSPLAGRMLANLQHDTRDLLACSPHDAYAWLARFVVQTHETGFRTADMPLLETSIALAPREGWLVVKRLRLMLDIEEALAPALQARIAEDFTSLAAHTQYAGHVTDILAELSPERRQPLLRALAEIPEQRRAALKWRLAQRGIEAEVPGLAAAEPRPWR